MSWVEAPSAGRVVALADVPDPVFSAQMVGAGCGIEPPDAEAELRSPIAGKLLKAHPHAFIVLGDDGRGVLVHAGIDTVSLEGEGFTVLAEEKSTVTAGQPIVRWNPADVRARNLSAMVLVVQMDSKPDSVACVALGRDVAQGERLFELA